MNSVFTAPYLCKTADILRGFLVINNYEKNLTVGNLILVDLASYYIGALTEDYSLFEELLREVAEKSENSGRIVRFIGDCPGFLFHNRHFEQCFALETWLSNNAIDGNFLCPYQFSPLKSYLFEFHRQIYRYALLNYEYAWLNYEVHILEPTCPRIQKNCPLPSKIRLEI